MNGKKLNKSLNKIIVILFVLIGGVIINDKVGDISFAFKEENNEIIDNSSLEIYFFDVGQADSILIKNNDNSMLIDAGNNEDGENLVNYLKDELKLNDIDIVIGTHPHEDHIGGLDNIIDNFDIGKIYLPDATTTSKTFSDVLDSIENKNYSVSIPIEDEVFDLGNMKFKVIYVGSDESDLNNTSIVLRMSFGNTVYLFTGDATSKTENNILDKEIEADVLKVGHHGSSYSTTNDFLDKVNPKYAIIQVGENNSYGHPNDDILEKLKTRNIKVYRTDLDGTIKLISDGTKISFETIDTDIDG